MQKRDNIVSLIVGGRGRRKTSYVKNVLWPLRNDRRIIIVDTFDNPVWHHMSPTVDDKPLIPERGEYKIPIIREDDLLDKTKGIFRIFSSNTDDLLSEIQLKCRNCTVLIEDATRFLEGNLDESVKRFVLDTKQTNIDLLMVFHSLSDTPPKLGRWSDYLTLFKTQEEFDSTIKKKFSNPQVKVLFDKIAASKDPFVNGTVCLRA